MPDLYFKVSIHHPELGFAAMDVDRLSDKLTDAVEKVFPLCSCIVVTINPKQVPDQHPAVIAMRARLESAEARIAELEFMLSGNVAQIRTDFQSMQEAGARISELWTMLNDLAEEGDTYRCACPSCGHLSPGADNLGNYEGHAAGCALVALLCSTKP